MVYNFFDERSTGTCAHKFFGCGAKSEIIPDQELAEKLHEPIIIKF